MLKEYNVWLHYETLHAEKYKTLQGKERRERLNELFAALREQQTTGGQGISDAAVKASKTYCQ